ncbi:MAG: hypothetical protein PHR77_20325 [Kiritimatiellae bacterium]|nr:hypothetical protein [Kiritimatiellia bacterium]MDD5519527.1 hypothetical protein [Kiritimatiellia bacterium]
MYTPKISEELVPVLYRLAKDRKMPMTRLVDGIIRQALASNTQPQGKLINCRPAVGLPESEPCKAVA